MKKVIKKSWLIVILSLITAPVSLMAQTAMDTLTNPGDNGGTEDVPPTPTPFDGGVSILVAAGVAYGLKKVHERKKAEKDIKL